MLFRVEHASAISLAEQIAVQVRIGIVNCELVPGERLPPARDLAAALGVNMHTVLRAYSALREDGIIEMRQGRGAWVRPNAQPAFVRLTELAEQLVTEARKLGLSRPEVLQLIERT